MNVLERKTFTISRLAEFASRAELVKLTGHPVERWPLAIIKEISDNALDSAEEAGVAPMISIAVDTAGIADGITVDDRGPGMTPETVASIADFTVRTSSREAYVSPTRGAQGNALQTILAMGYALSQTRSETVIESQGVRHTIALDFDPVRRIPRIEHLQALSSVKNGVRVRVAWPDAASSILHNAQDRFLPLVGIFAWLNPHAAFTLSLDGERVSEVCATDPAWSKWRPSQPTSAHWYDVERLSRLIGATIAHAEDRGVRAPLVRNFIEEFDNLSATTKRRGVIERISAHRLTLDEFFAGGEERVRALLSAMQAASKRVKPEGLGFLGKDHLLQRMTEVGGHPDSFAYQRVAIETGGLPYGAEVAFAWAPEAAERDFIAGLNFSPVIGGNPFRTLGSYGSLDGLLERQRAGAAEPIVLALHLTAPRLSFLDRGKAQLSLPYEVEKTIAKAIETVTAKWAAQRKREERASRSEARRHDALVKRDKPMTVKEAAWEVMPQAYAIASSNGTLPANPRQIYYPARGPIIQATGNDTLSSQYFCQTLLVDYIEEKGVEWDIVWDDRGHFREPHTKREIGLGTLAVRSYLSSIGNPVIHTASVASAQISTLGPPSRFRNAMFVEKEGFLPILAAARLLERFDIAVMSSKGMSTTAARQLVDGLAAKGVRLFVLHDFDIAGFSIRKTLTESGRRYKFKNPLDFVDLGLRLADVDRLGLESEPVALDKNREALRERLKVNGATDDEIAFLLSGRRVELNAMPSNVFVRFIEDGLRAHGVEKVIPDGKLLGKAYAELKRGEKAKAALKAELERLNSQRIEPPDDLEARVRKALEADPAATWDAVLSRIAREDGA
jgi:DNA topoisomerase VI subunit B